MGYIRHHAIIVTSYSEKLITEVHGEAKKAFNNAYEDRSFIESPEELVSPIVESITNGYYSFFIAPDGSKEGWEESDYGDMARKRVIDFIDSLAYEDGSNSVSYAELFYGDDEGEAEIERHN